MSDWVFFHSHLLIGACFVVVPLIAMVVIGATERRR